MPTPTELLKKIESILNKITTPPTSQTDKTNANNVALAYNTRSKQLKTDLENTIKELYDSQQDKSLLDGASSDVRKMITQQLGVKKEDYLKTEVEVKKSSEELLAKGLKEARTPALAEIVTKYQDEKDFIPLKLDAILKQAETNHKSFFSTEPSDIRIQNDFITNLTKIASKFTKQEQFDDMHSKLNKLKKIGRNMLVISFKDNMLNEIAKIKGITISKKTEKHKKSALSTAIGLLKKAAKAPGKAIQKITGRKNGYSQLSK